MFVGTVRTRAATSARVPAALSPPAPCRHVGLVWLALPLARVAVVLPHRFAETKNNLLNP